MKYLEWRLDEEGEIEPEMPLGKITLTGDSGRITDDNLMLDSFMEALVTGLSRIRTVSEVTVDTLDEPLDLVFRRLPNGVQISYGTQTTVVKGEVALQKELVSVVEALLCRLDEEAIQQSKPPAKHYGLRSFLAGMKP